MLLDLHYIVSQKYFQYKVLNWSTLLPLLPLSPIQVEQERGGRKYDNYL